MLPAVPAVRVDEAAGTVRAPFRLRVPAPPDISITLVAAAEPAKVIPPFAFSVPVVITIFPTRDVVVLVPAKVISPETVAVPALMFHAVVTVLADGWLMVTAPLTVSALVPPWVKELPVPLATKFNDVLELSLFIV